MYLIVEMEIVGTVSSNKYIIVTRVCLLFYTPPSRGKYTEATVKMEVLFKKKKVSYMHDNNSYMVYSLLGGRRFKSLKVFIKLRN